MQKFPLIFQIANAAWKTSSMSFHCSSEGGEKKITEDTNFNHKPIP